MVASDDEDDENSSNNVIVPTIAPPINVSGGKKGKKESTPSIPSKKAKRSFSFDFDDGEVCIHQLIYSNIYRIIEFTMSFFARILILEVETSPTQRKSQ